MPTRRRLRYQQAAHKFARPAILLAVIKKEIFQRQCAHLIAAAQFERGVERNQHRREIADRRAVGDIAADGAGRAHLHGAEAAQHFGDVRIDRAERRRGAGERNDGAEFKTRRAFFDGAKLGHAADMNDLLQRRELLGDPQPDIGGAGDDGGVRVFHIELREGLLAGRRGEERRFIADEHIRLVVERAERLQPRRRLACELIVGAGLADFDRRIHDRPIAGAATEIAGQHVVDGVAAGTAIARMIVREQAHHDAGRAEAALRAMQARHRFLHGMQRAVLGEVFDRDQLCAVDLAEQRDAGVNRLVHQTAVALARQHHGAGAAIALRAALLGAGRALLKAQPIKQRGARRKLLDAHAVAASDKLQGVSGHLAFNQTAFLRRVFPAQRAQHLRTTNKSRQVMCQR